MIDSMPAMAWRCRPDGFLELVKGRWLEYTSLSLEQSLGQRWTVAIHPDDLDHVIDRWRHLVASAQPGEMEARLRSGTGNIDGFLSGWDRPGATMAISSNGTESLLTSTS
jgi:PAS domain-containing protein